MKFKVGDVICGTTPDTRTVMGRILEINHWFEDETMPVANIVIEDFPTIGRGLQRIHGWELQELEIVHGTGLPPTKWTTESIKEFFLLSEEDT